LISNWTPLSVLPFYILAPVPLLLATCGNTDRGGATWSTLIFIHTVLVVSCFALPIVLAHVPLGSPVVPPFGLTLICLDSLERGDELGGWVENSTT
uniref:Cytochrome c oxidase subunit 1 n=1 Tax=Mesocestoides corti TaxID=53468 RepID=A0A0R3UNL6_MESCO